MAALGTKSTPFLMIDVTFRVEAALRIEARALASPCFSCSFLLNTRADDSR